MGDVIAFRAVKGKGNNGPIAVGVELIQDLSAISSPIDGFLRRHRHRVKTLLSDGTRTDTYVADYIDRASVGRDAVGFVPFARKEKVADTVILLRRQVRYPAWVATQTPLVCEVPAGVIDEPETPEETACRELYEEAGIEAELKQVRQLGRPFFILPGTLTELMYSACIEVGEQQLEAALQLELPGDGGAFEQGAEVIVLTLGEALRAIDGHRSGAIPDIMDGRTEIILKRLRDALAEGSL